ncbi:MAG: dissimilatory sulfite reductase D family protein [Desulfohalobium sp.]
MADEELKQKILDELKAKSKSKSKFYFSDLQKITGLKPREAKKVITAMITSGDLVYWSSGSTTMYSLPGMGKQSAAEGED